MKTQNGTPTAEDLRIQRLQDFTDSLISKRKAAIEARGASGDETVWDEDEAFYSGRDEGDTESDFGKGKTLGGPMTPIGVERKAEPLRSRVFVNITQTYVDMAAAAVADMLLPTDDMPFGVEATPEPDLVAASKMQGQTFTGPDGKPVDAARVAKGMLEEAAESAKKAETKIWDWLTESQWHAEVRKVIDEAARIGTSVLKGPVPAYRRKKKVDVLENGEAKITIVEGTVPESKKISPRDFFPDPACGENIHNGSYTWERDRITGKQLRELKKQMDPRTKRPYYLTSQIDLVLAEGPNKEFGTDEDNTKPGRPDGKVPDAEQFTIWYFYGMAGREQMEAAGCTCPEAVQIPCFVTMVNDRVIKVTLSPLDSGEFPYDVLVWQRVAGKWTGRSEARLVRTPQRMINAATRALMDNAGLAAGPIVLIDQDALEPTDGKWAIAPRKVYRKVAGAELPGGRLENAMVTVEITSQQEQLLAIIRYAIEMADRVATMPMQQQGQQGVTQETAEGRRILQNNASVTKRRLAKLFDDNITEPHIGRYYEWLLLYVDDPTMKRDLVIDARGSTALFERDAQAMAVAQMAAFLDDPEYGIDKNRWITEFFKSNKLDPKRFRMTEDEIEKAKKAPPPKDPKIAVAEIGAAARLKAAAMDRDRDTIHVNAQAQRDRSQESYLLEKLRIDERLKVLEYATKRNISLDQARTELAKVALELRTQVHLATNRVQGAPEVAKPPMEPAGRAPDGEAFQK